MHFVTVSLAFVTVSLAFDIGSLAFGCYMSLAFNLSESKSQAQN